MESTCALNVWKEPFVLLSICHFEHVVDICSVALMELVLPVFPLCPLIAFHHLVVTSFFPSLCLCPVLAWPTLVQLKVFVSVR